MHTNHRKLFSSPILAAIHRRSPGGQVMLGIAIFFLAFSLTLVLGFTEPVLHSAQAVGDYNRSSQSYFAAESLAADLAYRMKNGMATQNSESLSVGGASASAQVTTNLSAHTQSILSAGSFTGLERSVSLTLTQGAGVAFNYGVQSGEGGFALTGGASVNGNVYSNGPILADSGVQITGTAVSADSAAASADQSNDSPTPITSCTSSTCITFDNASASEDLAQSFQVSTSGTLNKVDFYLEKVGSPGNLTVYITTDSGGHPASAAITSATLSSSLVTASFGWVTVTFPTGVNLVPGTTYWLVLHGSSNSNKYYLSGANSSYSSGVAMLGKYGGAWNATFPSGLDAYFRIWLGGVTGSITQSGSTYMGAVVIGGDAHAYKVTGAEVSGTLYCQTGSSNNKSCTSASDPGPESMPLSDGDINDWKTQAADGGVISGNYSVGSSGATLGPDEITGNLTVGGGGTLTVSGTLYVQGSITISSGATVKLAASYGSDSGVIVSDGTVTISGGSNLTGSGISGSYIMIVTTSDCPFNSNCGGNPAISLSGGANSVILNAQNGDLTIQGGTTLNQATAFEISASGGATLTYNSGLANQLFSNGPSGGYSITEWSEVSP